MGPNVQVAIGDRLRAQLPLRAGSSGWQHLSPAEAEGIEAACVEHLDVFFPLDGSDERLPVEHPPVTAM